MGAPTFNADEGGVIAFQYDWGWGCDGRLPRQGREPWFQIEGWGKWSAPPLGTGPESNGCCFKMCLWFLCVIIVVFGTSPLPYSVCDGVGRIWLNSQICVKSMVWSCALWSVRGLVQNPILIYALCEDLKYENLEIWGDEKWQLEIGIWEFDNLRIWGLGL